MLRDDESSKRDALAVLLDRFQESLAGESPHHFNPASVPSELWDRFEENRAVLQYLHDAWPHLPRSGPTDSAVPDWAAALESRPERPVCIDRFEVRGEIGHGGYGVVFLAFDPKLRRNVALKVPTPGALLSPALRQRFLREARAAAAIDHPNVVPVLEAGEAGPILYIASTYCERGSLSAWIAKQKRRISARLAARIVAELADGIQRAHEKGILHRDLKPSNILLREPTSSAELPDDGQFVACVADFGLSKALDDDGESKSSAAVGTPQYMSPEQAAEEHGKIGPRTDVYGLGTILYELLTGFPPFDGKTRAETLRHVIAGEPRRPRRMRRDVPPALESICLTCLSTSPDLRYPTAAALAQDLRRFLAGNRVVPPRPTLWARGIGHARLHARFIYLALSILVVVPCLALGWARFHRDRAAVLLEAIFSAELEGVPKLAAQLAADEQGLVPQLRLWAQDGAASPRGVRAALALLPRDESQVGPLCERIVRCDLRELTVIRDALVCHQLNSLQKHAAGLWTALQNWRSDPGGALRVACALAAVDAGDVRWREYGPLAATLIVERVSPPEAAQWARLLSPIRDHMRERLEIATSNRADQMSAVTAATALAELEADRPVALARLILKVALPEQLRPLAARLSANCEAVRRRFVDELADTQEPAPSAADSDSRARAKANAAACLCRIGCAEAVWQFLESDPDGAFATYLTKRLALAGAPPLVLFQRISAAGDSARRTLVLALGEYSTEELGVADRERIGFRLLESYRTDPDPGVHSAIAWLLRGWDMTALVAKADMELCSPWADSGKRWCQGPEGHTLTVIQGPAEYTAKWRDDFTTTVAEYPVSQRRIDYTFAIATTKVTVAQYRRFQQEEHVGPDCYPKFLKGTGYVPSVSPSERCPINSISFYAAARYCNWLSMKAGLPADELCYEPLDSSPIGKVRARPDHVRRRGYRLPTDEEWPFACSAGAHTRYYFGSAADSLKEFEWFEGNSNGGTMPVGLLKPNAFGLHDTMGSLYEWTSAVSSQRTEGRQLLRGKPFAAPANDIKTWNVIRAEPAYPIRDAGFRVARTIAPPPA